MIDTRNTLLTSEQSSLKLYKEGTGSLDVPALPGAGSVTGIATIPHDYGSDYLLWQVAVDSGYVAGTILPWQSNSGRPDMFTRMDATNLYIYVVMSANFAIPAHTITYSYRILIP